MLNRMKQKGGAILMALAGLVLVSGVLAASLELTVQQTEQAQDNIKSMQGTAIADSMRLMILEGYPEEVAFAWLARTMYDGESPISLGAQDGVYDGGLSLNGRTWGYSFDFSAPVNDITDLYDDLDYDFSSLPAQCRMQGNDFFVCDWNAVNSNKKVCPWQLNQNQRLMKPSKYIANNTPSECRRTDSGVTVYEYSGLMRFPPNTVFSAAENAVVEFQDAVIFGGDISIIRQGNTSGDIIFQEPVAVLGKLNTQDFLHQGSGIAQTGTVIFSKDTYVEQGVEVPDLILTQNSAQNWNQIDFYRVNTAYYYGEVHWSGETSLPAYVNQTAQQQKPAQIIFDQTLVSTVTVHPEVLRWPVNAEAAVPCGGRGGGNGKGKVCWSPINLPDQQIQILSLFSTAVSNLEDSDIQTASGDGLYDLVMEPYGYLSWQFIF